MIKKKSIRFANKIFFLAAAVSLCLASCSNFDTETSSYLKKYGDIATVKSVWLESSGTIVSSGGRYYVDSTDDLTINYTIDNPQNCQLLASLSGNGSEDAIIDILSPTAISVTYPQSTLSAFDCDAGATVFEISPRLYLERASDNYGQSYDTQLIFCNSPPPDITSAMSQIYSDSSATPAIEDCLVVCVNLPTLPTDVVRLTAVSALDGLSHSFEVASGGIADQTEPNGWSVTSAAPAGLEATYDGGPTFTPAGNAIYIVTNIQNLKSRSPFNITVSLCDRGGLSSSISVPSHARKLAAPTCNLTSSFETNTFEKPYFEFIIYAPTNASDATLHFAVEDEDGNPVADTNGNLSTSVGSATFRLYPKANGNSKLYKVTQACATKTGWLDSDDAAATFGSSGTVYINGETLSALVFSLDDGVSWPQDTELVVSSPEGAQITWSGTNYPVSTGDSPVTIKLEAAGSNLIGAQPYKEYYASPAVVNKTYNVVLSKVYVKSDGSDFNPGTKDLPFKTLQQAISAFASGDPANSANTIYVLDDMTAIDGLTSISGGYCNIVGCNGGTVGASVNLGVTGGGTLIQLNGGTLSLRAVTISGMDNASNGAVNVLSGTFIVKDKVVITGNAAGGTAKNLFLAAGQKIKIDSGGISGTKIGVTCAASPTAGSPLVFTDDYDDACGTTAPSTYFTSDKAELAIAFDPSGEEAAFITGGGGIDIGDIYSVSFAAADSAGLYTFTATATPTSGSPVDITSQISSWSLKLYYLNTDTGMTSATNSMNLSSFAAGTYIVKINAVYKGTAYSGEVEVTK